ncbi:suppressor of fused domain protein [Polyangium spumosum]|uniref:Suppressor of fused-like domain-containing protein n=1 Tax=Polyangium spumosum TaxID=889282 RepID=A0A6N7Q3N4_9BACT|nr:suppressor of fused domain protein [Polyangium spumosum]MRG97826.1 hypothetical protein [Polyangium spumosum]
MKDEASIAAHFERHLGRAQLVLRDRPGALVPRHVYGAPPCQGRRHWVLHTMGVSLLSLEGRKGEYRHFEFMMSLPDDWIPSERWPAYMLQRASRAIVGVGKAPGDGGVFFNSAECSQGSSHVFALLVAPSRQLPAAGPVEVYAMYPLTYDAWLRHRERQLDIATLPEVVVEWREMLR